MSQAPETRWFVSTFYFFKDIPDLEATTKLLEETGAGLGIKGLFILGHEGLNSTFAATSEIARASFQDFIRTNFQQSDLKFKNSHCDLAPFPRFKVKIRPEIVTLGTPDLKPHGPHKHLSPEEWDAVLKSDEDYVIMDTRNSYEVRLGTFEGAIDPKIEQFTEFPDFVDRQNLPKDKKLLIFCTGGIRCEKGLLELERRGYNNVYQLDGGILNYLEKFPDSKFNGECFVFDHRVAVKQDLSPTEIYKLCPHCGQPGNVSINCKRCDTGAVVCENCHKIESVGHLCSKNCVYHASRNSAVRGKQQVPNWKSTETNEA